MIKTICNSKLKVYSNELDFLNRYILKIQFLGFFNNECVNIVVNLSKIIHKLLDY